MHNNRQRFHSRRSNTMKMGLRGLLFTANPKHEPRAFKEISSLMERILEEFPEDMFSSADPASSSYAHRQKKPEEEKQNNSDGNGDGDDEQSCAGSDQDDDDDAVDEGNPPPQEHEAGGGGGGGGSTFADELRMELEGLKNDRTANNTASSSSSGQQNQNQRQQQQRPPRKPKRFRIVDTNCKGYVFVAINFADVRPVEEEEKDRGATTTTTAQQQCDEQQPRSFLNFLTSPATQRLFDITKRLLCTVAESDVPLLRFTFYVFPVICTVAPTLTSAIGFAEAVKVLVPVPPGKSAAKIETHFTVRNNSGISGIVLEEMKKAFHAVLPSNRYFVMNTSAGGVRRQRTATTTTTTAGGASSISNNNSSSSVNDYYAAAAAAAAAAEGGEEVASAAAATSRKKSSGTIAHISFMVLHSVALLAIQPEITPGDGDGDVRGGGGGEALGYGLHKMGASFADSLADS